MRRKRGKMRKKKGKITPTPSTPTPLRTSQQRPPETFFRFFFQARRARETPGLLQLVGGFPNFSSLAKPP